MGHSPTILQGVIAVGESMAAIVRVDFWLRQECVTILQRKQIFISNSNAKKLLDKLIIFYYFDEQ